MEYVEVKPKPLENIALSFSGGGFRAASYTLGCLSFMETLKIGGTPFTSVVNFISSASGGTVTNLAYTVSQRKGESFDALYKRMNEQFLQGSLLVNRVFEIMRDKRLWRERPLKSRNLINAFSMAYDEMLFEQDTFGILWESAHPSVKEVCANTTEFDDGMLFRFQNAGVIGNKFLFFKSDPISEMVMKKIKLADILACSSCFPVGFEPFMFPNDFTTRELTPDELEHAIKQDPRFSPEKEDNAGSRPPCFGIMDGGIDDNQGIDSFIRAEERLQNKNNFGYDLYIACDVSSNYTHGFHFTKENKRNIFQKPSLLLYLLSLLVVFGASLAGALNGVCEEASYVLLGISGFSLLLALLFSIKGFKSYRKAIAAKNTYGILIFRHLSFFLRLRVSVLLQLIDARASSAGYLAAVVFLKKIRRVSYDRLFEKISERKIKANGQTLKRNEEDSLVTRIELKHWRQFSLQNAIYLLAHKNNEQRMIDLKNEPWFKKKPSVIIDGKKTLLAELMQPSPQLQAVADLATEMDTTMWFDEDHIKNGQPAALLAAGQFTTCYNLLRYAWRHDGDDPYWKEFQEKLAFAWNAFNNAPYHLYNEYGNRLLDGFVPR